MRHNEDNDNFFYTEPRLDKHIDDPALHRLTAYYSTVLPHRGTIMDMCTSWRSWYPRSISVAVRAKQLEVYGVGLNAMEMDCNRVFGDEHHWHCTNLNRRPYDVRVGWGNYLKFDAVTCAVSINYLIRPLEICKNLLDATNEGGRVHLVISTRCFQEKAIRKWFELDERGRLQLVGGE